MYRAAPVGVARHDAAWAGGDADVDEALGERLAKCIERDEFFQGAVVGVDEGVVLIGGQRLLAAPLAAQSEEGKAFLKGRFGQCELEGTARNRLAEKSDHLDEFADRGTSVRQNFDEPLQLAMQGRAKGGEILGVFDVERELVRRVALQPEQIGLAENATRRPSASTTPSRWMRWRAMR